MSEHSEMTVREAGRRGGTAVKDKYGTPFYQKIGQLGGQTVAAERGPAFYSEIGRVGGNNLKASRGLEYYAAIGRKGGRTVRDRYGREYYQRLGRLGGAAYSKCAEERAAKAPQPSRPPRERGAKLSLEIARTIRAEYAAGQCTQQELADRYGVSQAMIARIVSYIAWQEAV